MKIINTELIFFKSSRKFQINIVQNQAPTVQKKCTRINLNFYQDRVFENRDPPCLVSKPSFSFKLFRLLQLTIVPPPFYHSSDGNHAEDCALTKPGLRLNVQEHSSVFSAPPLKPTTFFLRGMKRGRSRSHTHPRREKKKKGRNRDITKNRDIKSKVRTELQNERRKSEK